ncbi:MAG: hypothetical protein LBH62_08655 [Nitrososphaerota archaeon]|nr:hypothetical protein [Nitrososphaerota archaeon]
MKQAVKYVLSIGCIVIVFILFFVASLSFVVGLDVSNVASVTVGGEPRDVAFTPSGKYAYVTNRENVVVIDTVANKVVATVATSKYTEGIAITPDGKYAYVTHSMSETSQGVSIISTVTNTVVDTIAVSGTLNSGIAITHDGKYVYLTDIEGSVIVVSTKNNAVIANITILPRLSDYTDPTNNLVLTSYSDPVAVVFSSNDKYAYVGTGQGDNRIIVIDVAQSKIINEIIINDSVTDVAIHPDGKCLYVTGIDKFFIVDIITNTVTDTLTDFVLPMNIAVTNNGNYVCVPNYWGDAVLFLNTVSKVVDKTVNVGPSPFNIAFTSDNKYAYVLCHTYATDGNQAGTVSIISIDGYNDLSQAPSQSKPVIEFPVQLLVGVILVAVIAIFVVFIIIKKKKTSMHPHNGEKVSINVVDNFHVD